MQVIKPGEGWAGKSMMQRQTLSLVIMQNGDCIGVRAGSGECWSLVLGRAKWNTKERTYFQGRTRLLVSVMKNYFLKK